MTAEGSTQAELSIICNSTVPYEEETRGTVLREGQQRKLHYVEPSPTEEGGAPQLGS